MNINIFPKNKKQKAQVGAPFEVLIAVILMGFVILAGTFAMQNLSKNVCIGNKRDDFSKFKTSLRDVVLGSDLTYRTITLRSKPCFNSRYESVRLVSTDSKARCSAYCNTLGSNCLLLEYIFHNPQTHDFKQPIDPICMDLPTSVTFEEDIDKCISDTDEAANWETVNPNSDTNTIRNGTYKIYKTAIAENSQSTKICLIRKK
jgi:hypothetical protein